MHGIFAYIQYMDGGYTVKLDSVVEDMRIDIEEVI